MATAVTSKGPQLVYDLLQGLVGNLTAVHPDAFIEPVQKGGGIQPGAVARRPEHAVHQGGGAALAVGAPDMDKLQPFLRVAQVGQEGPDALQPRLLSPPLDGMYVI